MKLKRKNIKEDERWYGQRVTIKTPKNDDDKVSFLREVNITKGLADRHIIQCYHYAIDEELKLIMEHAEEGNITEALPKLQWEDKVRITGEIAHGLCYLHELGIVHCDIKSENVLLTKNLMAKLCDFGSAMEIKDIKNNTKCLGTTAWMAPETLEDNTAYSPKSDIYSLGVIMWEMAFGKSPDSGAQVLKEKLDNVPLEFHRTMRACLDLDPKRRPDAREISFLKTGYFLKEIEGLSSSLVGLGGELSRKNFSALFKFAMGEQCDQEVDTHADDEDNTSRQPDEWTMMMEFELSFEEWNAKEREQVELTIQYYNSGLFDQAHEQARQTSHHPLVRTILGHIYRIGQGVDANQGEARIWYVRAAEAGCPASQHTIGVSCFKANNHVKALEWYRKSAEGGFSDGQYKLGVMFYYGHGLPEKDIDEGTYWIQKAADQGNRIAMTGMGIAAMGQERYDKAMEWFLKVDDDRIAQYHIGYMYYNGLGVERNYITAVFWFKKAAGNKYGLAEGAMGVMHNHGKGTQVNLEEAKEWYLRAFDNGQLFVASNLGLVMRMIGGRVNGRLAHGYLDDASKEGDLLARADLLFRHL